MTSSHQDKWIAFFMSLAVPGSGQVLAGSLTALIWFWAASGVAIGLAVIGLQLAKNSASQIPLTWCGAVTLITIGLASAIHARTLFEPRPWTSTGKSVSRLHCTGGRGRAIAIRLEISTPLDAQQLWQRISDLPAFLTVDPFHERVVLMRDRPAQGAHLLLVHNAFGRRFHRFGRILQWEEGRGYAISDLSGHGKTVGFPHVFYVSIEPGGQEGSRANTLVIEVKGRWTSRVIPLRVGRLWIRAICWEHARLLRRAL